MGMMRESFGDDSPYSGGAPPSTLSANDAASLLVQARDKVASLKGTEPTWCSITSDIYYYPNNLRDGRWLVKALFTSPNSSAYHIDRMLDGFRQHAEEWHALAEDLRYCIAEKSPY